MWVKYGVNEENPAWELVLLCNHLDREYDHLQVNLKQYIYYGQESLETFMR